jgi:2-polyprenyl-3-methyl-5-hydroxy-6-metoxy-1,4-benzoquinol methylase
MLTVRSSSNIGATLVEDDYIRQRLDPRPGDGLYLVLSDLLLGLKHVQTSEGLTVLDYGAGGGAVSLLVL